MPDGVYDGVGGAVDGCRVPISGGRTVWRRDAVSATAGRSPAASVTDWLLANPDDPDHGAMIEFRDHGRRTYLRWGRRYLGWGVFVTRPR
jgi:hypothetical protein